VTDERWKYWRRFSWFHISAIAGLFGPASVGNYPIWPLDMSMKWALIAALIGRWADVFSTIIVLEVEGVAESAPGLGAKPDPGVLMRLGAVQSVIIGAIWGALHLLGRFLPDPERASFAAPIAVCICAVVALAGITIALNNVYVGLLAHLATPVPPSSMDILGLSYRRQQVFPHSSLPGSGWAIFGRVLTPVLAVCGLYIAVTWRFDRVMLVSAYCSIAWVVMTGGIDFFFPTGED